MPRLEQVVSRALAEASCTVGDVIVFACRERITPESVREHIVGADPLLVRSAAIWDIYESAFGDAVLTASGRQLSAHHTQIRWTTFQGSHVVQIAAYPSPSLAAGFRVWVEPATVVLLLEDPQFEPFCERLEQAQYLWERLRAHHGAPLLQALPSSLVARYPVPSRPAPLSSTAHRTLTDAVIYLNDETAIDNVIGGRESPQRAVERTLLARRVLQQHQARLTTVLDHSHGSIAAKYDSLSSAMEIAFRGSDTDPQQLLAPHRHLRDSLEETRSEISRISATASETASLVASATVGKLLDKSEANRTAGGAVAAALAVISLITTFTTIAAIPSENRHEHALVRLAAGIGLSAIILVVLLVGLARLSTHPSAHLSSGRRHGLLSSAGACVVASLGFLVACIHDASLTFAVTAGALLIAAATLLAAANDF